MLTNSRRVKRGVVAKRTDGNSALKKTIVTMKANALRDSMTSVAASELLGVSLATVRRWVKDGSADAKMIGGQLRFSRNEVQRLFQNPPSG
jgi:excisionase family DNA binding protein